MSVLLTLRQAKTGGTGREAERIYALELLGNVRRRYEETPEGVGSLAADLGIHSPNFYRLAKSKGWVRRNPPQPRPMPQALKILEEARALEAGRGVVVDPGSAASHLSPLCGERSASHQRVDARLRRAMASRVRGHSRESERMETPPHPDPLPVRAGERSERPARTLSVGRAGPSLCFAPLGGAASGERERAEFVAAAGAYQSHEAEPPGLSTIARLERAVLAELATIEAMRAAMGTLPQKPPGAALTVRTLAQLTQTLQHLQRLRASAMLTPHTPTKDERDDDDDMPRDIDEFRRDLARRIDAFVASRTEPCDAGGDAAVPAVDEARP